MNRDKLMGKSVNSSSFSGYVKSFYNSLDKKNYKTYSEWKWFRSKSSISQYKQTKNAILKNLAGKNFDYALEIGPGDGIWTELFLDYCNEIDAVDISKEMLKMAQERIKNKKVKFILGDFLHSRLKRKYSLIYSVRCIEYLPDKSQIIKKLASLAKIKAMLLIVTKNPHFIKIRKKDKKLHSGQIDIFELKNLIESNGFKVKGIYPAVFGKGFHFPIARELMSKFHSMLLKKSISPGSLFTKYFSESFLILAEKNVK